MNHLDKIEKCILKMNSQDQNATLEMGFFMTLIARAS